MARTSQALLLADAKNRSWRTFLQGLGADVAVALATGLLLWLPDADISSKEAWIILATTLSKTVLTAVASFVMRYKMDGSALPTPLPPDPQVEPAENIAP